MKYELDFIGVSEKTKDADAIGIHWEENGIHTIGIYDGGFEIHGKELEKIINDYYYTSSKTNIDFIVCSHSDQDHVSGLKYILENMSVKKIYMNRPWLYIDELYDKINDGRITKNSLENRLKETYRFLCELEELANEKNVIIEDIFQGKVIENKIRVLHPTKEKFISLIAESNKTDFLESYAQNNNFANVIKRALTKVYNWVTETWFSESLRENETTSAENETSVIVLGDMIEEKFLLVGDAGIDGLSSANDYYLSIGGNIKNDVNIYQIPHHGGRHNVSPSVLNKIIGNIVEEGKVSTKKAFVCAGKESDHPLKMVTNAFIRRGVKVYVASGHSINQHKGFSSRTGWSTSVPQTFSSSVEEWEN